MSGYPYPNDEFDTELDDSHALGIHHVRRSTWSRIWPYLLVVLVCAALAAALVTWFQSAGRPGSSATTPPAATTTTTASGSATPTDDATTPAPTDDETTPEPSDEPTTDAPTTDEPTDDPTTDAPTTAELDRSAAVRVLNATRTQGLAASRVATLKGAGWTNVVGDNFPSGTSAPSSSSVWYATSDLADEAQQVAEDLGLSTVTLVESLRGDISVVLVG